MKIRITPLLALGFVFVCLSACDPGKTTQEETVPATDTLQQEIPSTDTLGLPANDTLGSSGSESAY